MTQIETPSPPDSPWSIHWQYLLALLAIAIMAVMFHGIAVLGRAYPTGPDYGQMRLAVSILENGTVPVNNPYFQMGTTDWGQLPGAPFLFAIQSAWTGTPVFEGLDFILFFAVINSIGTTLLIQRIFRRMDAAIFAGMLTAISPLYIDMMSWAAYPNIMALALFPYVLIICFDYWETPSTGNMLIAVFAICGTVYLHHLSTLWLGLSLILFVLIELFIAPQATIRKTIPIALTGLLAGFPILLNLLDLFIGTDAGDILLAANRFDNSRVTWEWWSDIVTPLALPFLIIGLTAFLKNEMISGAIKRFIMIYLAIVLAFMFGWLYGLNFFYSRALFFPGIPLAIGAAAFYLLIRHPAIRAIMAIAIICFFAIYAYQWGQSRADFYEIVTPRSVQAMTWLDEHSAPDDVILVSAFYAFHAPHFLERPIIVGLTPDLIGNPAEIELSADGIAVLKGLYNMDEVLLERNIRYIMISAEPPDIPDQTRSQLVLDNHPEIRLVFQNADTLIYRVNSEWGNNVSD